MKISTPHNFSTSKGNFKRVELDSSTYAGYWQTLLEKFNRSLPGMSPLPLLGIIITCGLILAIGAPRWLAPNRFVTADEGLWLKYSGWFYYALSNREFATTYQVSHPGVTVMWTGLVSFAEEYPEYREKIEGQDRPIGLNTLARRDSTLPLRILTAGRRTIAILHILVLGLSFLFACRLFDMIPALIGFLLIAFDPFDIALSKVLQPDGLLAHLMLLSLLAFLVYLNDHKLTTLIVSAVAAGLAWLTKSPGLFLIPLLGLLMFFNQLWSAGNWNKTELGKSILQTTKVMAVWGMVGALVFCILWPAMWVDPVNSLVKIITGAIGYAKTGHESAIFFNGHLHTDGDIPDLSFYPINFLWRTTPVTLLGLSATIVLFIQRWLVLLPNSNALLKHQTGEENNAMDKGRKIRMVTALLFFALGFSVLMTLGLKKFDRYIMPSIVVLNLVSGISMTWLIEWAARYIRGKLRFALTGAILFGFVVAQAALALTVFPYFFSYYNPLLGGAQRAAKVMQIGWGEGLDQAARYINDKPNSDQLWVIAWYGNGPFSYFSKSKVRPLDVDHHWSTEDWDQYNKSDYAVIYIHEWQRDIPSEVLDRLRNLIPEYSVWIDGLEYVRIYKIQ